ncbi:MAG: hypothetical protein U0736_14355 [Gemmataceae bacterium]
MVIPAALGLEAVGEQGEVDLAAGGADLLAVAFDRGELILVDHLVSCSSRPDERTLPSSTLPQVRNRSSSFRW